MSTKRLYTLILLCFLSAACGPTLREEPLSIGLLDEVYSETLTYSTDIWTFDDEIFLEVTGGELPYGMALSSDGHLTGVPQEAGIFEFRVTAFAYDDGIFYDNDFVFPDSAWFDLFVTEESTNPDCPIPDSQSVSEIYLCAGDFLIEDLAQDETVTLDINFFTDFDNSSIDQIDTIEFIISYNTDYFSISESDINSSLLRESAIWADADLDVNIDNDAGEIQITLENTDGYFEKSGRLIDLPFTAKEDVPADVYDFDLEVLEISSADSDVDLPRKIEIPGAIEIEDDVSD